jgi:biopolymer transport protein ExbD
MHPARDRATLVLSADERASHGAVVGVMDRIRRAGILRISIETRLTAARP